MHAEQARSAAAFVDSVGVNVHLSYHDGPYGDAARTARLLHELHVRHVRDGVAKGQTDVCEAARSIGAAGARFTFITQAALMPDDLVAWAACAGPAIEAYEGINEYDIMHPSADLDWPATVRDAQRHLYAAVKKRPELSAVAVVAPSFTSEDAFRAVGDLTAYSDYGTTHDYFAAHEPEIESGPTGAAVNMRQALSVTAGKPVEATETGYGSAGATEKHDVDETTQATYLPRLFLNQYATGIVRSFDYELIDEGGSPFGAYGLVRANGTKKPSFAALAGMLALLEEPASANRAPVRSLSYAVDAGGATVRRMLFAKRDGRRYLALWLPTRSYDAIFRRPEHPAPVAVAIRFSRPVRGATLYAYDAAARLRPTRLAAGSTLHLSVTDRVRFLELPAAATR